MGAGSSVGHASRYSDGRRPKNLPKEALLPLQPPLRKLRLYQKLRERRKRRKGQQTAQTVVAPAPATRVVRRQTEGIIITTRPVATETAVVEEINNRKTSRRIPPRAAQIKTKA